jgi:NADH dehydrogenase (ubiquinone) 1 alpha subcomplex subunit 13
LTIAYGYYRVGVCNKERSGEKLLEREARYAMAPVLQAEEDRWYLEREKEIMKREAEIMKDVPGWKVGEPVYFTRRWVPRQHSEVDKNTKK